MQRKLEVMQTHCHKRLAGHNQIRVLVHAEQQVAAYQMAHFGD
jgi:hypothetical protein